RRTLEKSKFQAGCPVLAVAVEQFVNDATERYGKPDAAAQGRLLDLADGVFADWQRIMVSALRREGVQPARARRLAALVIASTEGTVAMCRAARSAQPLEDVRQELELVLSAAIAGGAGRPKARGDWDESSSRFRLLFEHDLFGKPLHTFPDHALRLPCYAEGGLDL